MSSSPRRPSGVFRCKPSRTFLSPRRCRPTLRRSTASSSRSSRYDSYGSWDALLYISARPTKHTASFYQLGVPSMIKNTPIGTSIAHAAQTLGTWASGTTCAIYAYPPESIGTPANAQLWVGTAVIDRASAYSFFPERLRVHVPIHGNGIRLHFQSPAETIALRTFAQYRFDGARPVQAELVDGAVVAFNLIVQADVAAEVYVLHIGNQDLALELDRIPAHTDQAAN